MTRHRRGRAGRIWRPASGVTRIFQNAGEEGEEPTRLMKRLARFTYADSCGPPSPRWSRPTTC